MKEQCLLSSPCELECGTSGFRNGNESWGEQRGGQPWRRGGAGYTAEPCRPRPFTLPEPTWFRYLLWADPGRPAAAVLRDPVLRHLGVSRRGRRGSVERKIQKLILN